MMKNKILLKLMVKGLDFHKFHLSINYLRPSADLNSSVKKVFMVLVQEEDVLTRTHLPKRKNIRKRRKNRKKNKKRKRKFRLNPNLKRKLRLKKSLFFVKITQNKKLLINPSNRK